MRFDEAAPMETWDVLGAIHEAMEEAERFGESHRHWRVPWQWAVALMVRHNLRHQDGGLFAVATAMGIIIVHPTDVLVDHALPFIEETRA